MSVWRDYRRTRFAVLTPTETPQCEFSGTPEGLLFMTVDRPTHEEEPVCIAWQRLVQAALIVFLMITLLVLAHYFLIPNPCRSRSTAYLHR